MKHFIISSLLVIFLTGLVLIGALINPGRLLQGETLLMGAIFLVVLVLASILTLPWVNATALRFWMIFSFSLFFGIGIIITLGIDVFTSQRYALYFGSHFVKAGVFFLLAFSTSFLLKHEFLKIKFPFFFALIYSVLIAFLVEYLQSILIYDFFNFFDVVLGFAGAGAYYILVHLIRMAYWVVHKI